ncbi:MAG: hypothetical protein AAGD86_01340, partial [Pseudomonadota bacterium]
ARVLLIAFEYGDGALSGPPFAVDALEVAERFGPWCEVAVVERGTAMVRGVQCAEICYELRVSEP